MIQSEPSPNADLQRRAETLASALPPLLVHARHLAASVHIGEHGRRRTGLGDDFWQYRPLQPGDSRHLVDHRRSARSDVQYVREHELQIGQAIFLWVDPSASMAFSSSTELPAKSQRAAVLALATSILMLQGGERVGLANGELPARRGNLQKLRLAQCLSKGGTDMDFAAPAFQAISPYSRALFVSDFLGPIEEIEHAVSEATMRGVRGVMLQVLDPVEESFPFDGRVRFDSMTGDTSHETLKAGSLRSRYLGRLGERRELLERLCRKTGWRFSVHQSNSSPQSALLWLYQALARLTP